MKTLFPILTPDHNAAIANFINKEIVVHLLEEQIEENNDGINNDSENSVNMRKKASKRERKRDSKLERMLKHVSVSIDSINQSQG